MNNDLKIARLLLESIKINVKITKLKRESTINSYKLKLSKIRADIEELKKQIG
jgi:hypothetical protein